MLQTTIDLDAREEAALARFIADSGLSRPDALHKLVTDALTGAGYLELHEIDEDVEVEGSA